MCRCNTKFLLYMTFELKEFVLIPGEKILENVMVIEELCLTHIFYFLRSKA